MFDKTGDFIVGNSIASLGHLLDKGVKVAMMYGDRDYQCNCKFAYYPNKPQEGERPL